MLELLEEVPALAWVGVVLAGLVFGSFGNVVIARLPVVLHRQWRADCANYLEQPQPDPPGERFNLAWPASRCPHCQQSLRWFENIPVLSYLWLRGRCRACQQAISLRYPLVELLTAALFVLAFATYGLSWEAIIWAGFLYTLVLMSFIDLDEMLLPDQLTLPLLWAGLILAAAGLLPVTPVASIAGAVAGYLFLWLLFWGFKFLTGKDGMGYGDFKLLAALGAWLGWQALPLVVLLASLAGVLGAVLLMLAGRHQRTQPMPFGPWLAVGGVVTAFYGDLIYWWYWSLL